MMTPKVRPQRPSLREVNCEARRQQILEATRQLIAAGGMRAVTMRALGARAGLSVTTLYNLIGGREEILGSLIDDSIDRMDQILEREAPLDDPLQRCRAVVTVSIRYVVENERFFRPLALTQANTVVGEEPPDRRISTRAAGMQSLAIRQAIAQGLISDLLDPDVLGSQIYHGWEAAFMRWGRGVIDEAGFEARALYGLYVALLGVALPGVRPMIEAELRDLEGRLPTDSTAAHIEQRAHTAGEQGPAVSTSA